MPSIVRSTKAHRSWRQQLDGKRHGRRYSIPRGVFSGELQSFQGERLVDGGQKEDFRKSSEKSEKGVYENAARRAASKSQEDSG